MSIRRPSFDSLPLQKDGPQGNAWGLYGKYDELGMLNLLTHETTIAAAKEIVHGVRVSTDWPLDRMKVPASSRQGFEQKLHHKAPRGVNDDILTFNTQSSSQWDGFRHFGYQDRKLFFNNRRQEDFQTSTQNGIHVWVETGGVVGRGVLLDYQLWAESQGIITNTVAMTTHSISLADLHAVADSQNVSFQPGDILFVRSGYVKAFNSLSEAEAQRLVAEPNPPAIGLESSKEILRWIWDNKFAAVAGDHPSFEAWPCQDTKYFLHEWLLAGWGVPIGELFDLEALAVECMKLKKWSFFFSSMPLKVPGGVASPPNGVAIL
jgi:Putative cyclase